MLAACSVNPHEALFSSAIVQGSQFKHKVYANQAQGKILHIYIEGDGKPWQRRNSVALDPTPRSPLMLKLMQLDNNAAVYVGRPCYFSTADDACSPIWWTHRRYAKAVVDSLNSAIDRYSLNYENVRLFGHSGGGSLAMLLAALRTDVVDVVTLAPNLDIDSWTAHHDYSKLQGSLNPATQPPLSQDIRQQHFLGSEDRVITRDMLLPTISRQHQVRLQELPGIDHNCCWSDLWQKLLQQFSNSQH